MNMYYDIISMNIFLFSRYRFTFINQYSYCSNIFHSFIRFYRFSIDFKRSLFIFKEKKNRKNYRYFVIGQMWIKIEG